VGLTKRAGADVWLKSEKERSGASPDQPWPPTGTTPNTRSPPPKMFPAEAGRACNSRLSPPGKRRVHPHWAPRAAPLRRGQFPTWPPPEGRGTAPSPDQTRRGRRTPGCTQPDGGHTPCAISSSWVPRNGGRGEHAEGRVHHNELGKRWNSVQRRDGVGPRSKTARIQSMAPSLQGAIQASLT
jgi:hypothetical protein